MTKNDYELKIQTDPYHQYDFCSMWFKNTIMILFIQWDVDGKYNLKSMLKRKKNKIIETLSKNGWKETDISNDFKIMKKRQKREKRRRKTHD